MLTQLIDGSLRHRGLVVLAAALLAGVGLFALQDLPFDAYPDTTPVMVTVNAVAPALSPLEVERQITAPIEQSVSGLPGLVEVRSLSKFGFSQLTAVFDDDTDLYLARQVVGERIQSVALPDGVARPTLGPIATGLGEVFQYLVQSDTLTPRELRTLHHWVVRPRMLQVPGVAEINTWGGFERQYHVIFDPAALLARGLILDDVARALSRNNHNVSGGVLSRGGEAQLVQGVGLATSLEAIADIVVAAHDGVPIRVGDVARVEIGSEVRRGAVTADGEGEVVLGLGFMLMGENSRDLTRRLEARLAEVAADLTDDVRLTPVYSRTTLIDEVLDTVRENLFEGALLVIAVLFAFLGSLRAGIIVALAIPLSMLFAFDAMLRLGVAGSLMSLGAIDFGLIVDSSVIMVENVERRLAEEPASSRRSVREIVRDAALEVRRPTLFGELIIAIVFLPILTLEGVEGKLFRPMALTFLFALAGSMVLSLTLMPALASFGLSRRRASAKPRRGNPLVRGLLRVYRPVLDATLRWRRAVLLGGVAALVAAGLLATGLGSEFLPKLREQAIVINTVRLAGVSLDESVRYGTQIERLLKARFPDEIAHIWTRTGTAEVATDPMGLEVSDVYLTLTPRERWTRGTTQDELMAAVAAELDGLPGMRSVLTQPIELRVNEMSAGIRSDVGVKLFGDDFEALSQARDAVAAVLETIPGAVDVASEQLTGLPIRRYTVDRAAIARYGIPASDVLALIEALGSRRAGEIVEGQRRFDLVLRLPDAYRDAPESVEALLVTAPDGQRVPLGRLVAVEVVDEPASIQREWARRRVAVTANVRDRDVGSFVADVRRAIDERVDLPDGVYVEYGGQFEHLERASDRLLVVVPLALLLVFLLLYLTFGRLRDAALIYSAVPFAAVGGVLALTLRDMPVSISAAVGFVAVSGVAVLDQIVLVSRARTLMSEGLDRASAIRDSALTRLRPVVMTSLVAALGFLPMALNTGVGAEVQRPLATVVIGGVATALVATLLLFPALYATLGGPRAPAPPPDAVAEAPPTP